ncbi:9969_t:CDS:2, partial [Paraglomus occultum]
MPRRQTRSAPARTQPRRQASTLSSPPPTRQPQASPQPPRPVPTHDQRPQVLANTQQKPSIVGEQKQPGLFGQMASTAAGVAVGSTIGHTLGAGISGLFGGRGESAPAPEQTQGQYTPQPQQQERYHSFDNNDDMRNQTACETDAKALTKCLQQNNHDINLCQWYLENLKACQQMAS